MLKACVEWFNEADERAGSVIETEEREDILSTLEEMAHVAARCLRRVEGSQDAFSSSLQIVDQ